MLFDTELGPEFDITNPIVLELLGSWMQQGQVGGVHLATPCGSWSDARHGPRPVNGRNPGPPPPLRSRDPAFIYGFSDVSPADLARIEAGNKTMQSTAALLAAARSMKIRTTMENPCSSMIWKAPPIDEFIKDATHDGVCKLQSFDMCQFGCAWRKRTRILYVNCHPSSSLCRLCQGKGGLCSATKSKHIQLTGWTRHSWRTAEAQEYPAAVAAAIASVLVGDVDSC